MAPSVDVAVAAQVLPLNQKTVVPAASAAAKSVVNGMAATAHNVLPYSDAVTVTKESSFQVPIDYAFHRQRRPNGSILDATKEDISLRSNLWTHFNPTRFLKERISNEEFERQSAVLRKAVEELPRDPFAKQGDGRYRSYARAHLLLHGDEPHLAFVRGHDSPDGQPKLGYYQGERADDRATTVHDCDGADLTRADPC